MILACLLYPTIPTYFLSIFDVGLVSKKKNNLQAGEHEVGPSGVKIEAYH